MATEHDANDVEFEHVSKRFGAFLAVDDVHLAIRKGEFFSLLGPSGCGKTTSLRMIAGFEQPTDGEIYLSGQPVSGIPPYRRNVNMVFQNYALFQHLTTWQNVAFGLKRRKVPREEIEKRVAEALRMVEMSRMGDRKPSELSGGQQQRVALARALVNLPTVLLLDEPLGALDAKLRKTMQLELKRLQTEVGITFVYVTHDQEEALTMSDRLAVMSQGRIEQVGSPTEIYEHPRSEFVASFIGVSNVFPAVVVRLAEDILICQTDHGLQLTAARDGRDLRSGQKVKIVVRPEKLRVTTNASSDRVENTFGARIKTVVYVGSLTQLILEIDGDQEVKALLPNVNTAGSSEWRANDRVDISFAPTCCSIITDLEESTEEDLMGDVVKSF